MSGPLVPASLLRRAEGDPSVLAVLLFGSQARGEATSSSDVDICLVLEPTYGADASRTLLSYADLDVDVAVFQLLPLAIRTRALKEGKVLLVKDENALYDLAIRTAKAWEDFRPQYRRYLDAVLDDRP